MLAVEVGIAKVGSAIGKRAPHGLRHDVHHRRGPAPIVGGRPFEDIEHLDESPSDTTKPSRADAIAGATRRFPRQSPVFHPREV
jgi:hypothetical protein